MYYTTGSYLLILIQGMLCVVKNVISKPQTLGLKACCNSGNTWETHVGERQTYCLYERTFEFLYPNYML